jgi:hypothetical protein
VAAEPEVCLRVLQAQLLAPQSQLLLVAVEMVEQSMLPGQMGQIQFLVQ